MELVDVVDSKSTSSFPVTSALSPGTQGLLTIQYVICALCPSTMSLRFPGCDFWRGIGNANAGVLELVDEVDSKSIASDGVRVRVPPPAPRRSKVRFAPTSFMPTAKKTSSARSLAPSFQLQPAPLGSQLVCRPVGGFSRKRKDINFNLPFVTPPYIEENLPFACKRIILLISPHGGYEEVEDIWRTITTHKKLSTVCHEQSDIWKRSAGWWKKDGIAAKF